MSPVQGSLFDPAMLTADGMPRDCAMCQGTGERVVKGVLVTCGNCKGSGRALIPF